MHCRCLKNISFHNPGNIKKEIQSYCRILVYRVFVMYYSDELIEEVRSKNDIVDVISGYVKLQKKGSSYFGLCPFHNEKTPSFSVSRPKQMYYCFGCGAGGNVFTFLMEYENYSFSEAMQVLADRAGVELPKEEEGADARYKSDTKAQLLEINKAAAQYYYTQLMSPKGQTALKYLKDRGISEDTIRAFGLGYSNKYSDDLYRFLKERGYSDELLIQSGLITADEKQGAHDKFWNRVMFPIMDANSRVIGFGGRVLGDGKPKYLNSPETPIFDKSRNLYGLYRARKSRQSYFLLCEGYMDVISLQQAGFTNAVASLGTALTEQHASVLKRYVDQVYLTYDSDEAGTKAAIRAVPILKSAGLLVRVIRMDPHKDPDEFIKSEGAEAFKDRIKAAGDGFMFTLQMLERDYDMDSPEGKTAFIHEAADRLLEFEEEIERENYIEAVAKQYHVNVDDLRKLVVETAVRHGYAKPARQARKSPDAPKEDAIIKAQKMLLTWMASDEEAFARIRNVLSPEDFSGDMYRQVAKMLYRQYDEGDVNPARIISHFTDEESQRQAASLFNTTIGPLTDKEQEKALTETVARVKSHSIDEAVRQLDPADMEGMRQLMNAKKDLQNLKI